MGKTLRVLSEGSSSRVIDPEWKCQQSGDCCRVPPVVVMTAEEAELLKGEAAARAVIGKPVETLQFYPLEDDKVAMKAGPCPFVGTALDGRSTCTVYSVRPYNCRRFGCMRPKPAEELFEMNSTGCRNLLDRLEISRPARRLATLMQRKAQKWAIKHGWRTGQ